MSLEVRTALLRQTEYLIRTRGYADFSFADLAAANHISKAAVHHYFPTKAALASALLAGYLATFVRTLETIEREQAGLQERLKAYGKLFLDGFAEGMLPLCGALSAERAALPEALRAEVSSFFKLHLRWLARILRDAVSTGQLPPQTDIDRTALLLLSALEGGSLVGWAVQTAEPVLSAFNDVVAKLTSGDPTRRDQSRVRRKSTKARRGAGR
jgi:TetR/AcrR family transcriptional repressor of nem operon